MVLFKLSSILIGFSEAVVAIEFLTLISFGGEDVATIVAVWTSFGG